MVGGWMLPILALMAKGFRESLFMCDNPVLMLAVTKHK